MQDLFCQQQSGDNFNWIVALFRDDGAPETIQRANNVSLRTYYPIRFNGKGEPKPLWRPYLFIEFRRSLTLQICRSTNKFLKVLSMRNEEGVLEPTLVPKHAIDESLELVRMGKFNERSFTRKF